ncbi:hypothetical protein VP01_658g1 [Puccinia sorghi]|uniref:Uncharacterized protein n=1 Tax=Puccinia sorghi TaxID=27349 RepID=A0A0L6UG35_9BASI|nr:hypothetical protein VP01_658g1 [Puccinia sorghi]
MRLAEMSSPIRMLQCHIPVPPCDNTIPTWLTKLSFLREPELIFKQPLFPHNYSHRASYHFKNRNHTHFYSSESPLQYPSIFWGDLHDERYIYQLLDINISAGYKKKTSEVQGLSPDTRGSGLGMNLRPRPKPRVTALPATPCEKQLTADWTQAILHYSIKRSCRCKTSYNLMTTYFYYFARQLPWKRESTAKSHLCEKSFVYSGVIPRCTAVAMACLNVVVSLMLRAEIFANWVLESFHLADCLRLASNSVSANQVSFSSILKLIFFTCGVVKPDNHINLTQVSQSEGLVTWAGAKGFLRGSCLLLLHKSFKKIKIYPSFMMKDNGHSHLSVLRHLSPTSCINHNRLVTILSQTVLRKPCRLCHLEHIFSMNWKSATVKASVWGQGELGWAQGVEGRTIKPTNRAADQYALIAGMEILRLSVPRSFRRGLCVCLPPSDASVFKNYRGQPGLAEGCSTFLIGLSASLYLSHQTLLEFCALTVPQITWRPHFRHHFPVLAKIYQGRDEAISACANWLLSSDPYRLRRPPGGTWSRIHVSLPVIAPALHAAASHTHTTPDDEEIKSSSDCFGREVIYKAGDIDTAADLLQQGLRLVSAGVQHQDRRPPHLKHFPKSRYISTRSLKSCESRTARNVRKAPLILRPTCVDLEQRQLMRSSIHNSLPLKIMPPSYGFPPFQPHHRCRHHHHTNFSLSAALAVEACQIFSITHTSPSIIKYLPCHFFVQHFIECAAQESGENSTECFEPPHGHQQPDIWLALSMLHRNKQEMKHLPSKNQIPFPASPSIIPITFLYSFLSHLDRSNLGNARVAGQSFPITLPQQRNEKKSPSKRKKKYLSFLLSTGLQESLAITDHQFSIALTVTFVLVIFLLPSTCASISTLLTHFSSHIPYMNSSFSLHNHRLRPPNYQSTSSMHSHLTHLLFVPRNRLIQPQKLLKKVGANIMIPSLVAIWGLVTTLQDADLVRSLKKNLQASCTTTRAYSLQGVCALLRVIPLAYSFLVPPRLNHPLLSVPAGGLYPVSFHQGALCTDVAPRADIHPRVITYRLPYFTSPMHTKGPLSLFSFAPPLERSAIPHRSVLVRRGTIRRLIGRLCVLVNSAVLLFSLSLMFLPSIIPSPETALAISLVGAGYLSFVISLFLSLSLCCPSQWIILHLLTSVREGIPGRQDKVLSGLWVSGFVVTCLLHFSLDFSSPNKELKKPTLPISPRCSPLNNSSPSYFSFTDVCFWSGRKSTKLALPNAFPFFLSPLIHHQCSKPH